MDMAGVKANISTLNPMDINAYYINLLTRPLQRNQLIYVAVSTAQVSKHLSGKYVH